MCQQFHQYQQHEQPHLKQLNTKNRPRHGMYWNGFNIETFFLNIQVQKPCRDFSPVKEKTLTGKKVKVI